MINGVRTENYGKAMTLVDIAASVTLEDLQAARIDVAAAAHQLVNWYLDEHKPKKLEKPGWLLPYV